MELSKFNNRTPIYSYTRTELLSIRTKTSLLSYSTVDRLKDSNIGCYLPRRHRSSRGVKWKKEHVHPFVVASSNAQSVKHNDMSSKRCEISTSIKDNCVDLFFLLKHGIAFNVMKRKLLNLHWIWREIISTSIAISWQWNCHNIQINLRL